MRWSPFLPVDSGVHPLPHFFQASMLLQMWMPRSLTRFTITTSLPLALRISETLQPRRLLRIWPRCKGLLVFGEEYSITTFLPSAERRPKFSFSWFSRKKSSQKLSDIRMLRKPFTTLNLAIIVDSFIISAPISLASCSGLRPASFPKGNTTTVRSPSNSGLVFWKLTCWALGSCPYKVLNDLIKSCLSISSNIMVNIILVQRYV